MVLDKTERTESLEAVRASSMRRLREEREMQRAKILIPFEVDTKSDCVTIKLKLLKSQEPDSDNLFFRNSIIGYEWGDLQRAIVYAERFTNKETIFNVGSSGISDTKKALNLIMFRDGFKDRNTILSEGKLAMADLLTQLCLLSISLEEMTGDEGWDFGELRELGAQHLEERHKDFKRDGWTKVKK